MKSPTSALLVLLATIGGLSSASSAILSLGSYTKTTDGDQTFSSVFNGGTTLFNHTSGNVYVVFTTTFSNPANPGTLDTTSSYGGYSHSGNDLFGQNWEQSTVGVTYYGGRNDVAGVSIIPGTAITMVVKYELNGEGVDGDTVKFWVNPTLGTGIEGTPSDANPSRIWNPASISSDDMMFRRGNGSDNVIQFTNVRVYSGGDSPFAVVPEPSVLLLGGISLLGLLRRRR
jgi:hypothetical protein